MPKTSRLATVSTSTRRSLAAKASLAVASALTAAGVASVARADSADQRRHELQDKLSEARSHADRAREQETALAGDIAAQSERIDAVERDLGDLRGELAILEERLAHSRSRLATLEEELDERTRELARARQQLGVAQSRLNRRVVDIYTSDEPDVIAVVLGSETLEGLIEQLETRSRVLENDAEMVDQIGSWRARVTRERACTARLRREQQAETSRLAAHTSARRAVYASLIARRDSLARLRSARRRSLATVQVQRREWEAQADALEAESARLASLIATAPPPLATASPSSGFVWPVRGTLVSPFGQRWGRLHAGIDVAAPAGTPIVASASGQVIYAAR